MTPIVYSPHPLSEYRLYDMPVCEARRIEQVEPWEKQVAVWNLFWLSSPSVDILPIGGKRPDWFKHYEAHPVALASVMSDALADENLSRILLLHPIRFLRAFEIDCLESYECYGTLGGEVWVETVSKRAAMAARRMAAEVPSGPREGNVYSIRGGRVA